MKNQFGFSLIELMIVVSIIIILTSFALPSYKHYTIRARFTEVMTAAEPYKIAVSLASQEGIPLAELNQGIHEIPLPPPSTKNLASLTVSKGVITALSTPSAGGSSYILKLNEDDLTWTIEGTCIAAGLCPV